MAHADPLTVIPEATARVSRLGELLRAAGANQHASRVRLISALERLHAAEVEALQRAANLHEVLAIDHGRVASSLSGLGKKIDEAQSHVSRASESIRGNDLAGAIHHLSGELRSHLDGLHHAVGGASTSIHGAHTSLTHARGSAEQAIDHLLAAVQEHSGIAADAAHHLVSAIAHASDTMSHSVDHAAETCTSQRADFSGFMQQLASSTIRSTVASLVGYSREQVESTIRPKARAAVHTLVEALVRAAGSLQSHSHDVRSHTSEARGKFTRMHQGVTGASSKAGDAIHQARAKRDHDHDPNGGSHV